MLIEVVVLATLRVSLPSLRAIVNTLKPKLETTDGTVSVDMLGVLSNDSRHAAGQPIDGLRQHLKPQRLVEDCGNTQPSRFVIDVGMPVGGEEQDGNARVPFVRVLGHFQALGAKLVRRKAHVGDHGSIAAPIEVGLGFCQRRYRVHLVPTRTEVVRNGEQDCSLVVDDEKTSGRHGSHSSDTSIGRSCASVRGRPLIFPPSLYSSHGRWHAGVRRA
jgi:hypothetical protein